jgi:HSP20 family molecular chaperone IbpA
MLIAFLPSLLFLSPTSPSRLSARVELPEEIKTDEVEAELKDGIVDVA